MFIRKAVFFILSNSFNVIQSLYLSPPWTWIDKKSEFLIRSSLLQGKTSNFLQVSKLKFSLHAITCIPNAFPIFATCDPTLPKPIKPRILPFNSTPIVVCQYPWYILSISSFKFRANPKIKVQVNSGVGFTLLSVPLTIIFLFFAATRSIDLFLNPLVIINFNLVKFSIKFLVIGVLSLITNKASKSANLSKASASSSNGSLKIFISYFPESFSISTNCWETFW